MFDDLVRQRRRRGRELQRRHRRPASASGTRSRSEINPRDRLPVDQRLRRRRAGQGHGLDLPGAERPHDAPRAATATRRCGTPCRSATSSGPLFGVIGHARGALHARADGPRPARRRRPARRAHLAASRPSRGTRWSGRGSQMRTGNVVPRLAPFGIFPTTDGYVAVCAPDRAVRARRVRGDRRGPSSYEDERFSSRDRRVANAAELHALIAAWAATSTTAEATAALDAQRRRRRPSCATPRPPSATRAALRARRDGAARPPRARARRRSLRERLPGAVLRGAGGLRHAAAEARRAQRVHPRRAARLPARADRGAPRRRRYLRRLAVRHKHDRAGS